jgi:hypothetical protein
LGGFILGGSIYYLWPVHLATNRWPQNEVRDSLLRAWFTFGGARVWHRYGKTMATVVFPLGTWFVGV